MKKNKKSNLQNLIAALSALLAFTLIIIIIILNILGKGSSLTITILWVLFGASCVSFLASTVLFFMSTPSLKNK